MTTPLRERLAGLPALIAELTQQIPVPGLSIGVLHGDEIEVFVHGLANVEAGIEVTPDTVFQIGSNTKLWTATATMRLVEDGKISLEDAVSTYVPELRLAGVDPATVTVRHLLTHTGGFLGAYYGSESTHTIADFVAEMSELGQLHPPGQGWSYCNSGWVLLGRVIEKVTGQSYCDAVRALVLDPLGDVHTQMQPQDLEPSRTAMGYAPSSGGELELQPYGIMPACAPAGSVPVSTPAEVLRFVKMHLDEGRSADGAQLLSPGTVKSMQIKHADVPPGMDPTYGWGLGWALRTLRDGQLVIGHGGGTPSGHVSSLEVVPDKRIAIVVLNNCPLGGVLAPKFVDYVLEELGGSPMSQVAVQLPDPPLDLDLSPYVGDYTAGAGHFAIVQGEQPGSLLVTATVEVAPGVPAPPAQVVPLAALSESVFAVAVPGVSQRFSFGGHGADGRAAHFFSGGRIFPRATRG